MSRPAHRPEAHAARIQRDADLDRVMRRAERTHTPASGPVTRPSGMLPGEHYAGIVVAVCGDLVLWALCPWRVAFFGTALLVGLTVGLALADAWKRISGDVEGVARPTAGGRTFHLVYPGEPDVWRATGVLRVDGIVSVRWADPWPTSSERFASISHALGEFSLAGYALVWDFAGAER